MLFRSNDTAYEMYICDWSSDVCSSDLKNQLSQEQLAEKAELSNVYISYLERGERMPSLDAVINIANALNVSADDLLSGCLLVSNSRQDAREFDTLYGCSSEELSIILKCMAFLKDLLKGYKITK